MWSIIPIRIRISVVVVSAFVIFLIRFAIANQPDLDVPKFVELILSSATVVAVIGFALGETKWAWRLSCILGFKYWYPDLNGKWTGTVTSSFGTEESNTYSVEMTIDQRWSRIRLETKGTTGSKGIATIVVPRKDGDNIELWTHFIGMQVAPSSTDERQWNGSSHLSFDRADKHIRGAYWTDRASHILRGGGTSGTIDVVRS